MGWFNGKAKRELEEKERQHDDRVEVVVSKEATKDVVQKAKQANEHLNELLKQNHFTIKIYLAAGGKRQKRTAK